MTILLRERTKIHFPNLYPLPGKAAVGELLSRVKKSTPVLVIIPMVINDFPRWLKGGVDRVDTFKA